MDIQQEIRQVKTLFGRGMDLLLLRLRILGLDVGDLVSTAIGIVAMVGFVMVLVLVSLVALLLGLNAVLPEEAKAWVFFGCAGVAALLAVVFWLGIPAAWAAANRNVGNTLQAMQEDWSSLRGGMASGGKKSEDQHHV